MPTRIPSSRRHAGVCYAITPDDIELPVVDITHPTFAVNLDESEVQRLRDQDIQQHKSWQRKPRLIQRLLFGMAQKRSILLSGLRQGEGTFLSGLNTYLMKLGPNHMDSSFSKHWDQRIAQGVPITNIRLRLHHMASLLAEELAPFIRARDPRRIRFVNIAGGPAMDCLNALLLLNQMDADGLRQHAFRIQVLDQDSIGPGFGAQALESLREDGAPLRGLDACFEPCSYDWRKPEQLPVLLEGIGEEVGIGSSEGGLFEYGSDEEILENLETLRRCTPGTFTISGSASLDLPHSRARNDAFIRLAGRQFNPDQLETLAARAAWKAEKRLEGPTAFCFLLRKA